MPSNPNFVGGKLAEQLLAATNGNKDNSVAGGDKAGGDRDVADGNADSVADGDKANSVAGGDRDATTTEFFNEINKNNNYYMNSHWVPSHD